MNKLFWDEGVDLFTGCTHKSKGCDNCWSAAKTHMKQTAKNAAILKRYGGLTDVDGHFNGEVRFNRQDLERFYSKRGRVFAVWNEPYHSGVASHFIFDMFVAMRNNPQHKYLITTKRPERAASYLNVRPKTMPINVYHLTTTENQARLEERMPHIIRIPGVKGLIIEPMLGPIDILRIAGNKAGQWGCGGSHYGPCGEGLHHHHDQFCHYPLNFIILGGESGPKARPIHPNWVRSVRDQCKSAGISFHFKGWGHARNIPKGETKYTIDGIEHPHTVLPWRSK